MSSAILRVSLATLLWCIAVASAATGQETRRINAGEPFKVSLPFQSGTGVHWTLSAPESFQVGSQVEFPQKGAPGSTVKQKFTLTPTVPGDFHLTGLAPMARPGPLVPGPPPTPNYTVRPAWY